MVISNKGEKIMSEEKINIGDWFNPKNIEHIRAYKHLEDTGFWPEGFIEEGVINFIPGWQYLLASKMADCWVKLKLAVEEIL
jgi:hypothetical protein